MREDLRANRASLGYLSSFQNRDIAGLFQRLQRGLLVFLLGCFCILPGMAFADSTQSPVQAQPLISQEIRYHWSDAGEVFLVWGVNKNWDLVPEAQQPPGTVVKDTLMHTPMQPSKGYFSTHIKVPSGTKLNYLFRITKTSKGELVEVWDNNRRGLFATVAEPGGVTTVQATIMQESADTLLFDIIFLLLLLGSSAIFVVRQRLQAAIMQLARNLQLKFGGFKKLKLEKEQAIALGLTTLIVLGLVLRLWVAWKTNQRLPDTIDRLVGDEVGYDNLGNGVRHGYFFERPGRTPAYPLFLTLCYLVFGHTPALVLYVQAFLGASAIPLTFLLARRFTGAWCSLLAAALIALHPSLILHTTRLYTEILYIPLLLLVLLLLLKALETSQIKDFTLAGGITAVANLCRPSLMLFTVAIPFLLPRRWKLKRKISSFLAYVIALILVTSPWTYHNYLRYNKFLPYSVSTGVLWLGSPEYYRLSHEGGRASLDIWKEHLNPARNGGHDPFTIEGDRYFKQRAIASIKAEPGLYAWYCLQKVVHFWFGNPKDWSHHLMHSVDAFRDFYTKQRIVGIFAARLMPLVALAGLFVIRDRWREFWPLLVVCGYFTGIHSLTYAQVRFSEPLHPILAIIIAVAVGEVLNRFRHPVNPDLTAQ